MNLGALSDLAEVTPQAAWETLANDTNARLVDVRSRPEWGFVGGPDVSELGQSVIEIEWATYPGMLRNAAFVADLEQALAGQKPSKLLFLCRSGARSMQAAMAVSAAPVGQGVDCINIAEGFEGDLDPDGHRGTLNGWKVRGLPWCQT